jgi:hypothetical protein
MATIRVSTQNQLEEALQDVRDGDTILLAAGRYAELKMTSGWNADFEFSQKVTIASEDPRNPAVINQMFLRDVANVEIRDVTLDYTGSLASGSPDFLRGKPFFIEKARGLTIDGVTVDGHLRNGHGVDNGLNFKDSSDVSIENSLFRNFSIGIWGQNSEDISLTGNTITGMSLDGMQFGGMTRITIEGNDFRDFNSEELTGLHRDNIQFRTLASEGASRDIVIRGNDFDSAEGRHVIFIGNELYNNGDMSAFHRNVLIADNDIRGAHVYGVTVWHADGLTIEGNTLVNNPDRGLTDSRYVPIINVSMLSRNVDILDNIVASVPVPQNSTWTVSGNRTDGSRTYMHHYNAPDGRNPVTEAPSGGDSGGGDDGGSDVVTDVGRWDGDTLRLNGVLIEGDGTRIIVEGLDIRGGDELVLNGFGYGTFQSRMDGNYLAVWRDGASVRIDNMRDFHELAAYSNDVSAFTRDGDLVLRIDSHRGLGELVFDGLGAAFNAADYL